MIDRIGQFPNQTDWSTARYGDQTLEESETLINVLHGHIRRSEEEMIKALKHIGLSRLTTNSAIRGVLHQIVALLRYILRPVIDILNQIFRRLAAREADESRVRFL